MEHIPLAKKLLLDINQNNEEDTTKLSNDKILNTLTEDEIVYAKLISSRSKYWTKDINKLLRRWKKIITKRIIWHRKSSNSENTYYNYLGILSIVLNAIVATTIIATFQDCTTTSYRYSGYCAAQPWLRLTMGLIGLVAVAITSYQTFAGYQIISMQDKNAADSYEDIVKTIEVELKLPVYMRGDPIYMLRNITDRFTDTAKQCPNIPDLSELEYEVLTPKIGKHLSTLGNTTVSHKGDTARQHIIPILEEVTNPEIKKLATLLTDGIAESIITTNKATVSHINSTTDSDDEDKKVVIDIDLDASSPEDIAIGKQQDEIKRSIRKALEYELMRMTNM